MSFVQRIEQGVENRIEADVMNQMGAGNLAPPQQGGFLGQIETDIARRMEMGGGLGGGMGGGLGGGLMGQNMGGMGMGGMGGLQGQVPYGGVGQQQFGGGLGGGYGQGGYRY